MQVEGHAIHSKRRVDRLSSINLCGAETARPSGNRAGSAFGDVDGVRPASRRAVWKPGNNVGCGAISAAQHHHWYTGGLSSKQRFRLSFGAVSAAMHDAAAQASASASHVAGCALSSFWPRSGQHKHHPLLRQASPGGATDVTSTRAPRGPLFKH